MDLEQLPETGIKTYQLIFEYGDWIDKGTLNLSGQLSQLHEMKL